MSAEAIARLHIEVAAWDAAKASQQPNPDPVLESLRSESFLSPTVGAHVSDLRALLDAHAALEAAHTEALDALKKLQAAQKHVLEVMCAGEDAYMAACDGAEAVLAKAGRR